jgi:hypothetical protein
MTTTADSKKRIVLSAAKPGDVFDIHDDGQGRFTLVRLTPAAPRPRLTKEQCLKAIASAPLQPKMNWMELRTLTREL